VSTLAQRGNQVILHWIPNHVKYEGIDRADKLANEAIGLEVVEHAEQIKPSYPISWQIKPSHHQIHLHPNLIDLHRSHIIIKGLILDHHCIQTKQTYQDIINWHIIN